MESIWFLSLLSSLTPPMLSGCSSVPGARRGVLLTLTLTLTLSLLKAWLRNFGYLSQASGQMSTMQSTQMLPRAISRMQSFYGLQVTGELNAATIA